MPLRLITGVNPDNRDRAVARKQCRSPHASHLGPARDSGGRGRAESVFCCFVAGQHAGVRSRSIRVYTGRSWPGALACASGSAALLQARQLILAG